MDGLIIELSTITDLKVDRAVTKKLFTHHSIVDMSNIITTIAVSGKEQAIEVVNALGERYNLYPTDPANTLDISNKDFNVYYDAAENLVKMQTSNPDHSEEYIKELLISFPTFF